MVNRELTDLFPKEKAARGPEVLRVEGLSTQTGLKDINFSLYKGEVLGIAGLLGAGRTELARAIFGLDKITSGTIYLEGDLAEVRFTSPGDQFRDWVPH